MRIVRAVALAFALTGAPLAAAPNIGEAGPDFTLRDITGKTHTLSEHKGQVKAVALVWLSTQCPFVQPFKADYEKVWKQFKDDGVIFYGVFSNTTEPVDQVKSYVEQAGFTFPVLLDPGCKVADLYGIRHTPEVRVLNGNLILKYQGAWTNNTDPAQVTKHFTREAIAAVVAGKDPDPASTRAFGCSIKH